MVRRSFGRPAFGASTFDRARAPESFRRACAARARLKAVSTYRKPGVRGRRRPRPVGAPGYPPCGRRFCRFPAFVKALQAGRDHRQLSASEPRHSEDVEMCDEKADVLLSNSAGSTL
ncbi:hypothetical protein ISCGN_010428 [Ixodes scapularis]